MIGQQILNYKITTEIGKGGMATVYKAVHTKLDTVVAIKVLDPILATNESIKKRFIQEAKIMASLDHENVTRVIDFDDEKHLAIVMEYLDGQTLSDYVKEKKGLDKEESITLFNEILKGFAYAHSKGIIHRDVKPTNIAITKKGRIKIMDFGIAKIVENSATVLTQTGTQMGTPTYMSPEQVQDAKHIDLKTDIYSLGVTLWYMLSGKPVYDTTKYATFAIFTKIVNEKLPVLDNYPLLSEVIQKATEKDENKRFDSCGEFSKILNIKEEKAVKLESTKKKTTKPIKKKLTKPTPVEKDIIEIEKTIVEKPKIKKNKSIPKIKISDFKSFIGLNYGDTVDDLVKLYGKPTYIFKETWFERMIDGAHYMTYRYKDILNVKINTKTNHIFSITIQFNVGGIWKTSIKSFKLLKKNDKKNLLLFWSKCSEIKKYINKKPTPKNTLDNSNENDYPELYYTDNNIHIFFAEYPDDDLEDNDDSGCNYMFVGWSEFDPINDGVEDYWRF